MLQVLPIFTVWGEIMVYVILVLIIIFLFFFCGYLCKKNQVLSLKVKELQVSLDLEKRNHDIASVKFLSSNKVPIKEISKDIEDAIDECERRKNREPKKIRTLKEEDRIDKILSTCNEYKDSYGHAYEKNVLDTIPNTLSSVEICNNVTLEENKKVGELIKEKNEGGSVVMNEVNNKVNLNDFIKRDRGINITSEVVKEEIKKDNISFVEEISRKLESQLGPQTIELTDYEKEQEETAIISYKELLKVKEQLYEENVAKENEEFLKDLKALRSNLG